LDSLGSSPWTYQVQLLNSLGSSPWTYQVQHLDLGPMGLEPLELLGSAPESAGINPWTCWVQPLDLLGFSAWTSEVLPFQVQRLNLWGVALPGSAPELLWARAPGLTGSALQLPGPAPEPAGFSPWTCWLEPLDLLGFRSWTSEVFCLSNFSSWTSEVLPYQVQLLNLLGSSPWTYQVQHLDLLGSATPQRSYSVLFGI